MSLLRCACSWQLWHSHLFPRKLEPPLTSGERGCGAASTPALLSASVWSCTSELQWSAEGGRVKLFQETCNLIGYSDLLLAVLQNAAEEFTEIQMFCYCGFMKLFSLLPSINLIWDYHCAQKIDILGLLDQLSLRRCNYLQSGWT